MNERDRCKLDVCTMGHELVPDCLTGRFTTKGLLQINASGFWQWTLNVFDYLAGSTEGRDHE